MRKLKTTVIDCATYSDSHDPPSPSPVDTDHKGLFAQRPHHSEITLYLFFNTSCGALVQCRIVIRQNNKKQVFRRGLYPLLNAW